MKAAGLREQLRAERLTIGLDPARLSHDMGAVLAAAEAGQVHPRLLDTPRLPETLLEGLDDLDPSFRVWLLARRQAFHDRLMQLLEPRLRQGGAGRRALAQAILRLDPTHEEACRALMEAAAAEGDTAAALRAYEQLWTLLGDEYDMEPSAATQALVAEIKSGRFEAMARAEAPPVLPLAAPLATPAALLANAPALPAAFPPAQPAAAPAGGAAVGAAPARVALLVEPFSINGVPPERAHLVNGFRHELVTCLARFREWFVVDGGSLPPLADARVSLRYGITATAYQAGNRISMVLTLSEQPGGVVVWSERMDLSLENWFEAQQMLMRRIATGLNLHLSNARLMKASAEPDVSLEAYDAWLRAQSLQNRFDPETCERAYAMLQEAVKRTPNFAPAWSSLAQIGNALHIVRPGLWRSREREAESLHTARRAVELDPTDSRSQLCMGWSLTMAGRHAQGELHMRLALELNPYDAWTLMSVALFHSFCGEHGRAMELATRSLETALVPSRTQWAYHVTIAYLAGEDETALDACDRAEDVIRTLPAWRAAALANLGRRAEASEAARRFIERLRASWYRPEARSGAAMLRWLLHLYPLRHARDWARLRDGLAAAGLPVAGAAHGDWHTEPPAGG
jgi:TolB-like protein